MKPSSYIHTIKQKCPICESRIYAYFHTPSGDQPELGTWHVECTDGDCTFEHPEEFASIGHLKQHFDLRLKYRVLISTKGVLALRNAYENDTYRNWQDNYQKNNHSNGYLFDYRTIQGGNQVNYFIPIYE